MSLPRAFPSIAPRDAPESFEPYLAIASRSISSSIARIDKLIFNKIHKEINQSFKFAKKSNFPKFKSWKDLNISKNKSRADKILKNIKQKQFDKSQKVILPKGY